MAGAPATVAAPLVAKALATDPSPYVRGAAAVALGKLHVADAFETLRDLLKVRSHREVVQRAALDGLAALGDLRALAYARAILAYESPRGDHHGMRQAALNLFIALAPDEPETHACILAPLDDTFHRMRAWAAEAAGKLKVRAAEARLRRHGGDRSRRRREGRRNRASSVWPPPRRRTSAPDWGPQGAGQRLVPPVERAVVVREHRPGRRLEGTQAASSGCGGHESGASDASRNTSSSAPPRVERTASPWAHVARSVAATAPVTRCSARPTRCTTTIAPGASRGRRASNASRFTNTRAPLPERLDTTTSNPGASDRETRRTIAQNEASPGIPHRAATTSTSTGLTSTVVTSSPASASPAVRAPAPSPITSAPRARVEDRERRARLAAARAAPRGRQRAGLAPWATPSTSSSSEAARALHDVAERRAPRDPHVETRRS